MSSRTLRVAAFALAALVLAAPAQAGGKKWHGHHGHGHHHRHHHGCGHGVYYAAPRYVEHHYAYPVYHYAPSPAYYCGPCGHYFGSYDLLSHHVHLHHHIAVLELPSVIFQASIGGGAGWVFED
jgi:hypothetical protein